MHDMNFFSVYKRGKKSRSFIIFPIIVLIVFILLNGIIIGAGLFYFRQIEDDIQSMQDYINNPATKEAMENSNKIKNEVNLTNQYLVLLQSVDQKLNQMNCINAELLENIAQLTPETVMYQSAQFNGIHVSLNCQSRTPTGPMDMYHAFNESPLFSDVVMSGMTISETGTSFSISFVIIDQGEGE